MPASVSPGEVIEAAPDANVEDDVCCRRSCRCRRAASNLRSPADADLGLLRPAPDEIYHLIPHIVGYLSRGQSSPRLFFSAMCSAIRSARTSSLVCTFFSKNSIASVSPPPGGEDGPSFGRRPLHSRRTLFASGRTPSAVVPVLHRDREPAPCLKDGVVEWPPSPKQCSACALFSYVPSAILTDERFLHFQLRRDTGGFSCTKSWRLLP